MLIYLALVAACTLSAFVVSYRLAQWLQHQRDLSADVTTGLFLLGFLLGLLLVGAFVVGAATLTEGERMASGLLLASVLATGLFPAGIIGLKKNSDFT